MRVNSLVYALSSLMVFHLNLFYKGKRVNYVSAYISSLHNYSNHNSSGRNGSNNGDQNNNNPNQKGKNKIDTNGTSNKIGKSYLNKKFFQIYQQKNVRGNSTSENHNKVNEQDTEKEDQKQSDRKKEEEKHIRSENIENKNVQQNNQVNKNERNEDIKMKEDIKERLQKVKKVMEENNIDVYILINSDEHNSEIINDKDKKIYYLSNYSGADGILILTKDKQIIYVNALYELQANKELNHDIFTLNISRIDNPNEIYDTIASLEFNNIALDGKNTSVAFYEKLKNKIESTYQNKKVEEKVIYENNINEIVKNENINFLILEKSLVNIDNYPVNDKKVFIHDRYYNGACAGEKIEKLRQTYAFDIKNVDKLLLSELDEIAYILNLRGYDYTFSPLFYAYLYLEFDRENYDFSKMILFTVSKNLSESSIRHLNTIHVEVREYETVVEYLRDNVSSKTMVNKKNNKQEDALLTNYSSNPKQQGILKESDTQKKYEISMSPYINLIIYMLFDKDKILLQKSPVLYMKAEKNDVEIDNMKEAHVLDALALLQFFHWCEEKKKTKELFNETEISLKNKIDYFRSTKPKFIFPSFATISASGPNAAVIHYECTEATNTKIAPSIYLLDSGGQYLHGTTDVTRTTHFGEPTAEEKKIYTLVLKGHLHLRKVIFASYTNSMALDFIARENLFKHFLDYNHGTGHGVGLFLNVHEGGCSISPISGTPLKPFMVLSNEPGYYLKDKFGVRIENMQYVIEKKKTENTKFYSFQDLTLYPYEKKLMDFSLLTVDDIKDINEYHDTIRKTLLPRLKENPSEYDEGIVNYLMDITEPIAFN
ncbi:peptidase [Plasmodium gonderi]|uniref:Peptidase n=1 Tax=Plasmodium gonderi TaxID=77519 RepID=A0A1Y1JQ26_PLAGO|nr:peptidase [Plasmodium gonderi]GAW82543.1 peptidase [Plasmodium gonderi]